jgi:Fe-Mn family superoxide dismutase
MGDAIREAFGSFEEFRRRFTQEAVDHFASGWAWLVRHADGSLGVLSTHDAANPMVDGDVPLLTCDVWEHAYYLDYQNARPRYVEAFWNLVDWEFVEKKLRDRSVSYAELR